MSDPYSALKDQYDETWEQLHKANDEIDALRERVRELETREAEWVKWAERAIPELSEHASMTPMCEGGGVGDVLCMEAFQRLIDEARRGEG